MKKSKSLWRALLFFIVIAALCGSFALPTTNLPVNAAPQLVPSATVVISQVYGGGGNSGATYTNDFVELFNTSNATVSLSGWSIQYAAAGSSGTTAWNVTNLSGSLLGGQYYLVQLAGGANGSALPTPDGIGTANLNATDGKVALLSTTTALVGSGCPFSANVIDFIGYGSANCSETTSAPPPSATSADVRSSECFDTDNNNTDFIADNPNPRNTSTFLNACLKVVNVTSSAPNGTYKLGDVIPITVTFSNNVNVDLSGGTPTLTLETGVNDTKAVYAGGDGTATLTFNYTIAAGDTSVDLDYVDINSLLLNGSTITGAVGNAMLTLPLPGSAGSLSNNKDIAIDNQLPPTVVVNQASTQPDPAGAFPINFTVVFSEPINPSTFTSSDITQTGTATGVTWTILSSSDNTTFTLSATSATGTGTIKPTIAANQVTDVFGNGNNASTSTDNQVLYSNIPINVSVDQAGGQLDPTGNTPINFAVTFSNAIDVSSFTTSDITQNGTATGVRWRITDSGDHTHFTLSAIAITAPGITTLQPSIQANKVTDIAGNTNNASTSTDNQVTFNNNTGPSVTINQASGQADPTTTLPIKFTVVFSEAIIPSTFTTADIKQTGTATGVNWAIADSGDHTNFTLSATAATGYGTVKPTIAANRVTDLVGNNNVASTSSDNTVTYTLITVTPTNTGTPAPSVLINEVAWSGTTASSSDEWIELYNPGASVVDITGWKLYGDDNVLNKIGSPNIPLKGTIPAKSYFLLERDELATDVPANQVYSSGDLLNTGERLYLKDNAGNTIDTANLDGGAWPAGTASTSTTSPPAYASMERVGTTGNLWVTYQGTVPVAYNRNNGPIKGTPGFANWINTASVTTITSDLPDPSLVNQLVTVKVTVIGGTTTPTGTVTVTGANQNCTITLSSGTGSCSVKFTSVGTKTIIATYHSTNGLPPSNDTESHTVSTSGTIYKTPTPIPPPPPQLVVINEFVPRPGSDWNHDGVVNVGDEYIELLNHGTVDVNLSGWRLDDEVNVGSDPFSLPAKTIKPGERIVFYGSDTGLLLGDGGDAVRLLKPNGQLIDAYNYTVARYPDESFCRLPDNGGADDWNQYCFPTPGIQNSLSGNFVSPSNNVNEQLSCPISDTLPQDFVQAECDPFGKNIWRPEFWDNTGWFDEKNLPAIDGKWPVFAD